MGQLRIHQPPDTLAWANHKYCIDRRYHASHSTENPPIGKAMDSEFMYRHELAYLLMGQQARYEGEGARILDNLPTSANAILGVDSYHQLIHYPFIFYASNNDSMAIGLALTFAPGIKTLIIGSRPEVMRYPLNYMAAHEMIRYCYERENKARVANTKTHVTLPTGHVLAEYGTARHARDASATLRTLGDPDLPQHEQLDILFISEHKISTMASDIAAWNPDRIINVRASGVYSHVPLDTRHVWYPYSQPFRDAGKKLLSCMEPNNKYRWADELEMMMGGDRGVKQANGFPRKIPRIYMAYWSMVNAIQKTRTRRKQPPMGTIYFGARDDRVGSGFDRVFDEYLDEHQSRKLFI